LNSYVFLQVNVDQEIIKSLKAYLDNKFLDLLPSEISKLMSLIID
jgi:hypothetical protein